MANAKRRVKIAVRDDSVVWTLVRFKDDSVISEPLKLHRLEDEESGNDGVSARLEEGDWCLAPYQDGQKYLAKIIRTSDNKDVILKERQILMLSAGKKTEDQNEEKNTEVKLTEKRKERKKKQDQNEQENTEMVMTKNGKGRKRKQASQSNDHKDKDGDKLLKTSAKQKKNILEEKKKTQESRTATMVHAQSYILKLVSNSQHFNNKLPTAENSVLTQQASLTDNCAEDTNMPHENIELCDMSAKTPNKPVIKPVNSQLTKTPKRPINAPRSRKIYDMSNEPEEAIDAVLATPNHANNVSCDMPNGNLCELKTSGQSTVTPSNSSSSNNMVNTTKTSIQSTVAPPDSSTSKANTTFATDSLCNIALSTIA